MDERTNLAVPAKYWLRRKDTLKEPTVLQSFAFDEVHKHLYALQVCRGGADDGDLCLNKLDYKGHRLGHMYLRGFGHGVSMGVQNASDGTVWIWTEADAENGYGQGVTRFRFFDGAVRTGEDVKIRHPIEGSTNNQPSVCMASRRIAVRYRMDNKPRYRVWDLDAFVARDYSAPVADFAQTGAHPDPKIPFQGYALYRDRLYQLAGTAYDEKTNPAVSKGNAYVSCLAIPTGELLQQWHTEAACSLDYREPEGLAVRRSPQPRVYMGFASGEEGARRFSVYYKPAA
ncbi:Teichoic acid biosynthesis protein C (Precursor) [Streptomyces sp. NPDC086549]|uniref:phage baseplate protein n=1 Tax=Streptomyces sp. NPDC086549 TaxID=3365752 RepID=UPI003826817C